MVLTQTILSAVVRQSKLLNNGIEARHGQFVMVSYGWAGRIEPTGITRLHSQNTHERRHTHGVL